jgi:hypothetical protein
MCKLKMDHKEIKDKTKDEKDEKDSDLNEIIS